MDALKPISIVILTSVVVWMLYPSRQLARTEQQDVVEIVYMGPGGPIAGATEDAVREFERLSIEAHKRDASRPIYRVISGQNACKDYTADPTRFLVSVAGGMPPDVIYFDRYAIAEWAARGAFDALDDYIARDLRAGRTDTPQRDRFFASVWDEAVYGGKVYGIPCSVDDRALYYNADLLIRAGLVDERGQARPPRTWEQLEEYAARLCEYDENGRMVRAGIIPDFGNTFLYVYGYSNGAEFLSADGKRIQLNEPRVLEALEFMTRLALVQGGYEKLSAFKGSFQSDALDPFAVGKIAMKIDGVWWLETLGNFAGDMNFGVAPIPRPKAILDAGGAPVSFSGGWAYAIPASARHKEAAWEFIRFMSSERAMRMIMESERGVAESQGRTFMPKLQVLPALNEWAHSHYVVNNPQLPPRFREAREVFNDLLPYSRFRPSTPVGQLLWTAHLSATQAALYETLSPKAALDEGTDIAQRALDRFLTPPSGTAINSWKWFFVLYGILLAGGAAGALWWQRRRQPDRGLARRQWGGGVVCAAPWLIGFIVFGGGPMLFSLLISFCDYDMLSVPRLVGTQNYRLMFAEDRLMPIALWNTLFMVLAVPLQMAVSLAIALLLSQSIRAMALWRTLFYLPAIVPMVAAAVLWVWVFNPEGGLINLLLKPVLAVFGTSPPAWLQSQQWSKPALIGMNLWAAGGGMIIWLAGLKSIPQSLYEAAEVDGANAWQQFRSITIPQLSPYIFFNLVIGLIGAFQIFSQAFVMTEGGPVNSTLFYVYHLFNHAFRYGNMGYASAMAWVLLLIVLVLTMIQLRLSKRWVHYEAE